MQLSWFLVFDMASPMRSGSCVSCYFLRGGLGLASAVYCSVGLRWPRLLAVAFCVWCCA